MHVLLSNDDGIEAEGLAILRDALREATDWRLTTVAPDREQSAMSHALTLADPLRIDELGDDRYAVSGTPTDCVLVALRGFLRDDPPDAVVSGINHGPNMGEDVHYSGTVAAAFEGHVLGLPSFALSLASKERPRNFAAARHFVREILPGWIESARAAPSLFNVNLPACEARDVKGVRLCKLGSRQYDDLIVQKEDPRGRAYYWIGGDSVTTVKDPESDFALSDQGWVTVTPLQVDLTDHETLVERRGWEGTWKA